MEYETYINSTKWAEKRSSRLELDLYRCQTCLSTEDLEVHHRTYERLGDEIVESDLITLCRECHEAITEVIRRRKYKNKIYIPSETERVTKITVEVIDNGTTKIELDNHIRRTPAVTQRADSGFVEPLLKANEANHESAQQDGLGFRGTGTY